MARLVYNLLLSLGSYREEDDTTSRSLVFICHSFGGVVCKQALIAANSSIEPHFRSIINQTLGAIFLGTPTTQQGLDAWAYLTWKSAGIKTIHIDAFQSIEPWARTISKEDEFHAMKMKRVERGDRAIEVACFYEELPMEKLASVVTTAKDTLPGCIPLGMRRRHTSISKFESEEDPGFLLIPQKDRTSLQQGGPQSLRLTYQNVFILPPESRLGFEIALFCALTIEADAVEALFDHYWDFEDFYRKAPGDPNAYSTGSIGRHSVVLVHMSDMGKANAAAAAASCRNSFPNIKLALVVGVCGAVPSIPQTNEPIFLGDVILSKGVVQYDFGRRLPERFTRKDAYLDSLSRPNAELRSLLNKLQGNPWPERAEK
ncbi:hypothetical protein HJFPF1_10421 [Paramyrothecium foliicola]|nr:hypothetical protein HJFPF1_10421 [Paramyrothecium foliicola]